MRPHDISCRLCQERYNSSEFGCEICIPAKKNIIWPEVELPLLASILDHSIRVVNTLNEEVEKEIKARKKSGASFSFECVKAVKQLTDANIGLVAEARKLRKEDAQAVKHLSWDDKTELMLAAMEEMPDEFRKALLERMVARLRAVEGHLVSSNKALPEPAEAQIE